MKIAVAPNVVSVPSLVPKGGEGRSPQEMTKLKKTKYNYVEKYLKLYITEQHGQLVTIV